jgi:hypothetical protein
MGRFGGTRRSLGDKDSQGGMGMPLSLMLHDGVQIMQHFRS